MSGNLFSRLTAGFSDMGDRPFAFLDDGRTYSFQDVLDVSARFANVLTQLGVRSGDRVAVQVEKSIEALMLYLGTVRAGAVFLPLNTAYTPTEIDYFLHDSEPALFVCDPAKEALLRPVAGQARARLETLGVWRSHDVPAGSLADMALAASPDYATIARAGSDLAAILYTSGTTGRSKGAMLTHGNLLSNALTLVDAWRFTDKDVLLHALPIYHTHGLFVASNVALAARAQMIFLPGFNADEVIRRLPQATAMMGVPTFYTRLLAHAGFTGGLVRHMRLFISGSAPLLAETHKEFYARTGHAILERYGMTETSMNTSNPYDGERIAGTVGFPLPGIEVRVTDAETGRVLPAGEIGVLEVRGPNVFPGYWRMPEKTKEEFRADGFFITGDVSRIDGRGYVHIVGRAKDLIISGGFNVYPKEVESVIDDMPGVVESAVIGCPHPDFGEAVTAVVVTGEGTALTEAEVVTRLSASLAKFKQPKRVFFVGALPRNTMGKVQKAVLREQYKNIYQAPHG